MDGKISLQTRTSKYGKLSNGFLMKVDHNYIRRMKSHILDFSHVGLIVGTNGYLWIYSPASTPNSPISLDQRILMGTVRNAIAVLEKLQLPIYKETI